MNDKKELKLILVAARNQLSSNDIKSLIAYLESGDCEFEISLQISEPTEQPELLELHRLVAAHQNDIRGYAGDNESLENGLNESDLCNENLHAASVFAYLDDTIMAVPPEIAGAALDAAIEIFGRDGHTVHPGKSACWSLETPRHVLPASCQRIWHKHGPGP